MLYDYLIDVYGINEPILLSTIKYEDMSEGAIRQQIKKLTDAGILKRYDTGIYFIPKESLFKAGTSLPFYRVIEEKYLKESGNRCGYFSGVAVANELGLTTQVPMICEITSNKATNDYREVMLANNKVIIRRPKVLVNNENYRILQFLDLMKDIDHYSEVKGEVLKDRLTAYMEKHIIKFENLEKYLYYYPDKIYRNMYQAGLLKGVPE